MKVIEAQGWREHRGVCVVWVNDWAAKSIVVLESTKYQKV